MKKSVHSVFGKKIKVYDDVFPLEVSYSLEDYAINSSYRRRLSEPRADFFNRQESDFIYGCILSEQDRESPLIKYVHSVVTKLIGENYNMLHSYINKASSSTPSYIHTDCTANTEGSKTVLVSFNAEWHYNWGGELLFYDELFNEVVHGVAFKPNRIIEFDGRIPHVAKSPSSLATQERFQYAIKMEEKILCERKEND